ncbi:hypothetical protein BXZ70DRAFT_682707 [Cristinia sonorae]|uniref:MADS-box domain-containing protein n=1 Tax=Cristinia sonorae TaxID=1940300 RepID=A0A8K0UU01_9AGAR|nr:hypothetical protein BXZ70DRAFT_682707 [Cristinia sonorae]
MDVDKRQYFAGRDGSNNYLDRVRAGFAVVVSSLALLPFPAGAKYAEPTDTNADPYLSSFHPLHFPLNHHHLPALVLSSPPSSSDTMGRRKIEIQPITHERNRSVTFLKRKNGLFKKAYELGVLCSVDVAVIIFEERPGHHVKLYQYCSSDVHNIVQRHIRFDGEKDTRTPVDFSSNKVEEAVDDDDDDDADDGARPKPNGRAKPKTESITTSISRAPVQPDMSSINLDMDYHNARGSPHSAASHGSSTGLPVSGERHSAVASNAGRGIAVNNKRPRLAPIEHSPEHLHGTHSTPAGMGQSSAGGSYPYRLDVDLGYPPSGHVGGSSISSSLPHPHANPHPSIAGLYPQHANNVMNSHHHPQQNNSSFMPPSQQTPFDFSRPPVPPTLRSVTFPHHSPTQYTHNSQQQPGMFSPSHTRGTAPGGGGTPVSANNMFVELLGSAPPDHSGQHSQSQNFTAFDWPVHGQGGGQQQSRHEPAPTSQSSNEAISVNNWLDFLSGSSQAASHQSQQQHANSSSPPPGLPPQQQQHHTRPASNSVSSTRSYAVPPPISPSEGGGSSPNVMRRKRSRAREDDGVSEFEDADGSAGSQGVGGTGGGRHGSEQGSADELS